MLHLRSFRTALEPSLLGGSEKGETSAKAACARLRKGRLSLGTKRLSLPQRPRRPVGVARRRERGRSREGLRRPGPLTSPPHGRHGDGLISARVRAASLLATARSPALPPPGARPRVALASKGRQWGCINPAAAAWAGLPWAGPAAWGSDGAGPGARGRGRGRGGRRVRLESAAPGSELTCGAARAAGGGAVGGRAERTAEQAAGAAGRAVSQPRRSEGGGGEARPGGPVAAAGLGAAGSAAPQVRARGFRAGAPPPASPLLCGRQLGAVGARVQGSGRRRARAAVHASRGAWDPEPERIRLRAAGV